jgi:hypothetical protein
MNQEITNQELPILPSLYIHPEIASFAIVPRINLPWVVRGPTAQESR